MHTGQQVRIVSEPFYTDGQRRVMRQVSVGDVGEVADGTHDSDGDILVRFGGMTRYISPTVLVVVEPEPEPLAQWERELLEDRTLDPSDPFEAVLLDILATNRRKRADYTAEGSSPWSNFERVEDQTQTSYGTATEVLIATKQARLMALSTREGLPQNESVEDTLLDRAVYSIIALGRYKYPSGKVE